MCNKVGGIYTVLSTRALTLKEKLQDQLIFIGPDCWGDKVNPYFSEDDTLYAEWKTEALKEGLKVKVGRWTIPGEPVAVLVDFQPYYEKKTRSTASFGMTIRLIVSMPMAITMRRRCSLMLLHWLWKVSTSM